MENVKILGRPSKYDPDFCEDLIEHMSQGYSFESFAGLKKVNQDTIHEWAKVHPAFSEAKKIAFEQSRIFWERMSIEGLWNTKDKSMNTGMFCINMKNRFKWTDRVEVQGSGDEDKPLILSYKK